MKNLVLVKLFNSRGCDEVLDIREDVVVENYMELIEYVKENMVGDYEEWMKGMKEWWNGDSEEDIIENLVEGEFDSKWFNLMIGEEEGILCVEREYYNEVRKEKSDIELFDMFLEIELFDMFLEELYS